MIKKFIVLFFMFNLYFTAITFAKKEVPKSIPGVEILTSTDAVKELKTCIPQKKCIFIDPRRKKDLKQGTVKGAVIYTFKKKEQFNAESLLTKIQEKGHDFIQSYADFKKNNIAIISGCNGKFCPRSSNLLEALIEYFDAQNIQKPTLKWVRVGGVPEILRQMK